MKKFLLLLLALTLFVSAASASILPATGVDEDFAASTGISCTPAVILCQSLSVYDARGDQGGKKVETLRYSGKSIPVIQSWDGWAQIYYADGEKNGWVRSEYLLFDPAWYHCDESTAVYAYPDSLAPRVGLLNRGTEAPIITDTGDWVCVSLRAAAGWIRKTADDKASDTWFSPELLEGMTFAELSFPYTTGSMLYFDDAVSFTLLKDMLTHTDAMGGMVAGCPFGAVLTVTLNSGMEVELALATDGCCIYRVDGQDYIYATNLLDNGSSVDNSVLFSLFGVTDQDEWLGDDEYPGNG